MPSEAVSEDDWLHTDVSSEKQRVVKCLHHLRNNAFATSASSNKTLYALILG